jgi:hypothetical protein
MERAHADRRYHLGLTDLGLVSPGLVSIRPNLAAPKTILLSEVIMSKHPTGTASLYRVRQTTGNRADSTDSKMQCSPTYRGFAISCLGGEIETIKRAIDAHWSEAYAAADSPAARVCVLMDERQQRDAPREWPGDSK